MFFFFQAEDGIRYLTVTGVQTCALPIYYPRVIAAPLDIGDCFKLIPEIFNLADRFQCPGLVLCDLLLSEARLSGHPNDLDFNQNIDRGELITANGNGNGAPSALATNGDYKR